MGDRSNIVIQEQDERVWLYGHWMGSRSIGHAAHGLRSDRAGDAAYLARIVFCSMTADDPGGETGYGISASCHDNQNPILVIDVEHTWSDETRSSTSATTVWFEDREGARVSRVFSREEFLEREAESTWRRCAETHWQAEHDHEWPFEAFLRDAPDPGAADVVRDTGWPQLVGPDLQLARGGPGGTGSSRRTRRPRRTGPQPIEGSFEAPSGPPPDASSPF